MSYSSEVLADSPLGYWRLGDPDTSSLVDSSGNARHGTYGTGVTVGATGLLIGDSNTAVSFSSGGTGITVPYASWQSPGPFSIEAIFKPTIFPNPACVVSRYNGTVPSQGTWDIRIDSSKLTFYLMGTGLAIQYPTTLAANTRYHVVGTWDGTTARLYVEGALVGSVAVAGLADSGKALWIGSAGGVREGFGGFIDEVAFYSGALSASRINVHYLAQGFPPTDARVSRGSLNVLMTKAPDARVSQAGMQTLWTSTPSARASQAMLQVLMTTRRSYIRSAQSSRPILMKQADGSWWPVQPKGG